MFLNLIISKVSTQYHYSSTMVNSIGYLQIFVKQNRQRNLVINRPLKTTLTTSNNHNKFSGSIYFSSKKPITTNKYSRPSNDESYTFCIFLEYFSISWWIKIAFLSLFPISMLGYLFLICLEGCVVCHNTLTAAPFPIVIFWRVMFFVSTKHCVLEVCN